ncbi:MAG TPA: VOC family protein [Chitinophagaceae bacterium]|nr:VOC family protein [Chitinophagaceae bacterium]
MEKFKTIIRNAWPYQQDKMNLPVENVEKAIPFYEKLMGFRLASKNDLPFKSAILERDNIRIGLAENGGDPAQDGCFFEVDNVETAFAEFRSNGLEKEIPDFDIQQYGDTAWKVFFIVAPDGLWYCFGQRQSRVK